MSPFAAALGPAFTRLPPALRAFHAGPSPRSFSGTATLTHGRGLLAALAIRLGGFPPAGTTRLRVTVEETETGEHWHREFGTHRLSSRLAFKDRIVERLGPSTLHLLPTFADDTLHIVITRLTLLGLPMPGALTPRSSSREWQAPDGSFAFDIAAALPGTGLLVRYTGTLTPETLP
ncbi:DUF4166 domain-containing protein [Algicella marina]|uniref:DUF4166 domain-containing protein n=1 Tax=Algicella marina TaxID=2683284 RepID=A0A6P1SY39_9RHOB|nr:DUF4166 domain-containing protein [Algicella marina]QHQ33899.1 DUF4166 domain-containing protein [Algicella marina]